VVVEVVFGSGRGSEDLPEQVPGYNADGCDLGLEFFEKAGVRRQDFPNMELARIKNGFEIRLLI